MFVLFTHLGRNLAKISILLAFSGSLAGENGNIHIFSLSWLQILNLLTLLQKKIDGLECFHGNGPYRERTNQSVWICLRMPLPYDSKNLVIMIIISMVVDSRGAAFWALWWRITLNIRVHITLKHIQFDHRINVKKIFLRVWTRSWHKEGASFWLVFCL